MSRRHKETGQIERFPITFRHHEGVTSAVLPRAAAERWARAEVWLDDLAWHEHMYKESRFRWTGEPVMDVVTRRTAGNLDYTTLADLRLLHSYLARGVRACRSAGWRARGRCRRGTCAESRTRPFESARDGQ